MQEKKGSEELGWQQGAVRWWVKTGQHQHSQGEIQHGRLLGLHRLSCSNTTERENDWARSLNMNYIRKNKHGHTVILQYYCMLTLSHWITIRLFYNILMFRFWLIKNEQNKLLMSVSHTRRHLSDITHKSGRKLKNIPINILIVLSAISPPWYELFKFFLLLLLDYWQTVLQLAREFDLTWTLSLITKVYANKTEVEILCRESEEQECYFNVCDILDVIIQRGLNISWWFS